jgi:DNA-binding transcriptional LysR family regulator
VSLRSPTLHDLNALRAFLTVAATGSMTDAASRLGITQSAISQTIRKLEETAGVVLVDRGSRPLQLSLAGRALQRHAAPLVEDADALLSLVRHAASERLVELRVGIIDSFAATVGPSLIRDLLEVASSVSFRSGLALHQAEGLLAHDLDLIITSEPLDELDGLARHMIASEPFVLLRPVGAGGAAPAAPTAAQAPLRSGRPPPPATAFRNAGDLAALAADAPLIRYSARSQIGARIDRHLRRIGVRAARFLEVDTTDALLAMVASGLGWAISTPLCLLQMQARLEEVRVGPLPGPAFERQLYLICRAAEHAALSARIATRSREILARDCLPRLRRALPWLPEPLRLAEAG